MGYILPVLLLALAYLTLTSNLELGNILLGVLIAVGVTALVRPERHPLTLRQTPSALWALVRYIGVLFYDLITSGIRVARLVLDPALPLRQGILAIPSPSESELGQFLVAHAITLTPGETVVEMDDQGVLYTHCLDATESAEIIAQAQQLRQDMLRDIVS